MSSFIIHRIVLRSITSFQLLLLAITLPTLLLPGRAFANNDENIRRLLHLTEYIGADYSEAVRDGQIINEAEFTEMTDFSQTATLVFKKFQDQLPEEHAAAITADLQQLEQLIQQKGSVHEVRTLTNQVKQSLLAHASLQTAPSDVVNYAAAQKLYNLHCASCHGAQGQGDGPAGAFLEPPPRNFHEEGVMAMASALRFYNVLLLGVDDTSMASYKNILSDSDLWSLSFYLLGMRYAVDQTAANAFWEQLPQASKQALSEAGMSLEFLSTKTDEELKAWLDSIGDTDIESQTEDLLAALRLVVPYTLQPASKNTDPSKTDYIGILTQVSANLEQTLELVQSSEFESAHNLLLDTYLELFEKVEPLLSSRSRDLVSSIEVLFIQARSHANAQNQASTISSVQKLQEAVKDATAVIAENQSNHSSLATTGDFVASFIIIFREGIEAFLIIAALLALLKNTNSRHLARYVHGGWIAAIVAGILTFLAMNYIWRVSGATKEVIEAVSSGLAAAVLVYISFWLLNHSERQRWEKMIRDKVTSAVKDTRKQIWTLAGISFLAVYREAAETVLFYQALFAGSTQHAGIFSGLAVGLVVLGFICLAIYKLGLRLPLKTFFRATSALMILLAFILTGKAFNELIEAGYIRPTSLDAVPRIDLLGIYPNAESLAAQCVLLVICCVLVYWSQRQFRTATVKH